MTSKSILNLPPTILEGPQCLHELIRWDEHDEGVCEACGKVLDHVVERYGQELTVMIDESKQKAGDSDITTPR